MIVYVALGGVVLLGCLGVLVVGSLGVAAGRCPDTSVWPLLDFVANCEERGAEGGGGLMQRLKGCIGGDGKEVRRAIDVGVIVDSGAQEKGGRA